MSRCRVEGARESWDWLRFQSRRRHLQLICYFITITTVSFQDFYRQLVHGWQTLIIKWITLHKNVQMMKESWEVESLRITSFNQPHASYYSSKGESFFSALKMVNLFERLMESNGLWRQNVRYLIPAHSKWAGKKVMACRRQREGLNASLRNGPF